MPDLRRAGVPLIDATNLHVASCRFLAARTRTSSYDRLVAIGLVRSSAGGTTNAIVRTGQAARFRLGDSTSAAGRLFQETMATAFREAVERLTGRSVPAFISGNHLDPDIAAELFILDGPPGRPDPEA